MQNTQAQKKYEVSWNDRGITYERVYCTQKKKSLVQRVNILHEYYVPDANGEYTYILDNSVKLRKCEGSYNDGSSKFGFINPRYRNIRDNYWDKGNTYNDKARAWYIDIETRTGQNSVGFPVPEKALEEITLIQIWDTREEMMIVLGTRPWYNQDEYKLKYKVQYLNFSTEHDLLENYLVLFEKLNPLYLYGWNSSNFDYPYMYNRFKRLGFCTNRMSNYGTVKYSENEFQGQKEFKIQAPGHIYTDLKTIYKTFVVAPRADYKLQTIAEVELKESKINHDEYLKFDDFYCGNYNIPENPTEEQKNSTVYKCAIQGDDKGMREAAYSDFVYYGIKDVYLLVELMNKLKFTDIMLNIAMKMGVEIIDTLGTVREWQCFIANESLKKKEVMPPRTDYPNPQIVGGYVREPRVGKHRWMMSLDVNSMYPLLGMVASNMSPETYVPLHKCSPELQEVIKKYFNSQDESKVMKITAEEWRYIESVLQKENVSIGINGAVFNKSKEGMLPIMIKNIYATRSEYRKKADAYSDSILVLAKHLKVSKESGRTPQNLKDPLQYLEDETGETVLQSLSTEELKALIQDAQIKENGWDVGQKVQKVLINGLYGTIASPYFGLYNEEMARAITGNGRYFIRELAEAIEQKLQELHPSKTPYILYGDTDSIYYTIEPIITKHIGKSDVKGKVLENTIEFADRFEEQYIQPVVQNTIDKFASGLNAYNPSVIGAKREIIADVAVLVAKKKYFAKVRDNEGLRYDIQDPYIKIMGLELVKSSTPEFSKKYLRESLEIILESTESELLSWLDKVADEYAEAPLGSIAQIGGTSNLDYKLDAPGIPIGVRAALVHNNYIEKHELKDVYEAIAPGEKSKRLYLLEPNPLNSNIVSFTDDKFIERFKDYVDLRTNFEKGFIKPLQIMLDALGWSTNKPTVDLEDWG